MTQPGRAVLPEAKQGMPRRRNAMMPRRTRASVGPRRERTGIEVDDAAHARKRPPLSTCMALFANGLSGQPRERRSMTL